MQPSLPPPGNFFCKKKKKKIIPKMPFFEKIAHSANLKKNYPKTNY
jgi:hypothetical protein